MKTEREIAELIFDKFRATNCKAGHMIMERTVNFGVIDKLNPKEKELCFKVLNGLIHTGYITYKSDSPSCFFLTEKGYDYIYEDDKVAIMHEKPWIFPSMHNTDWDTTYNKLWRVIGPKESATHYIDGTLFYKFIMELCDDIPPTYSEYIEQRRAKNLSTSRSQYYRDLINHLPEDKRFDLYAAIQMHIEIFEDEPIPKDDIEVESFWDQPLVKTTQTEDPIKVQDKLEKTIEKPIESIRPKVFISYAWGKNEEYKPWVKKLADSLAPEIDVILDQNELGFGSHLTRFMTNGIEDSDRILVVLTPWYKKKSKEIKGGTAFEEAIISTDLLGGIDSRKILPVLLEGDKESSAPLSIKGLIYCDMTDEKLFDTRIEELKSDILNKFEQDKAIKK